MSDMEPFKVRLRDELGELNMRLAKLERFVEDDAPAFTQLDMAERRRLVMQLHHMRAYQRVLAARAEAHGLSPARVSADKILLEPLVLLMAFRYMLGRETYAVANFIELMEAHLDAIAKWHAQIVSDIKLAVAAGTAGAEVDVAGWRRLAETIEARSERA